MTDDERIRRPKPERKGPIRGGTASLFGPPGAPSGGDAGDEERGGPAEAVARAVDLGYRVVDDYIRQGQNAARLVGRRSYGPGAMANDLQDMAARFMQYGAELMDVWMQLLGQAAAGQAARPGNAPAGGRSEPRPTAERRGTASRVIVAIESSQLAEVEVDLDAPDGGRLAVQELQSLGGGPSISGAAFEGVDPPRLRIRVPDDHPPGTYCGLVLDVDSSLPAGSVVVRVLPPHVGGDARR
jgi:hypothetical protein